MGSTAGGQLHDKSKSIEFYEERYSQGYMADKGSLVQWPRDKKERVCSFIRDLGLPAEGKALDIGCGTGIFTEVLKQALPGWDVYGSDISSTAITSAKRLFPACRFFTAGEAAVPDVKFDLIFSHHVLEHVFDLKVFLTEINQYLKPAAAMVHILPCGNEGSFEDGISRLVKGGIDLASEERRFFEEPGHLRRLTAGQLRAAMSEFGFTLKVENYHNHFWSGIRWITEAPREDIKAMTNPELAIDDIARSKLARLRRCLLGLAYLRLPMLSYRVLANRRQKTGRERVKFAAALLLLPLSRLVDSWIRRKSIAEWHLRRYDKRGGEMFHFYTRKELDS